MTTKLFQRLIIFTIAALFSIYIGMKLSPAVNPSINGLSKITESQAHNIVRNFLTSREIDYKRFSEFSYFGVDESGSNFIIDQLGQEKFREIINEEQLPLSFWTINYLLDVPRNQEEERIQFNVSPSGKILYFQHFLPDSVAANNIDSLQAQELAEHFLNTWPGKKLEGFKLQSHNKFKKENRTDNQFIFSKSFPGLEKGEEKVRIDIAGKDLVSLRNYFTEPTEANVDAVGGANIFFHTLSILIYLIVTITGIILFLKLYHDGQIGVKTALVAGGIIYISQIMFIITIWDAFAEGTGMGSISRLNTKWIIFGVQLSISYVYIFVNSFTTWAVGDYYLRTIKPSLLNGTDALFNKKFFSKNIGKELPVGFAYGAILFGLIHVVNYMLIDFTGARPLMDSGLLVVENPLLAMLLIGLIAVFFDEVVFRKFLVTYLKAKSNSILVAITLSAFCYAFFNIFFGEIFSFWPAYYTLVPYFVYGVVQGWIFWNYGLLTSMASAVLYSGLFAVNYFLHADNDYFFNSAVLYLIILLLILIFGILAWFKGKNFEYSPKSEPEHIRRIKERLRMQQELDIAKKVQLGLLPKEQPSLTGFDIAGVCKPALEVGGDYFDFISLKDGRMALAIADVSGKGVPAAIYMTLTKGILQSHAESDISPKVVLSKVNSLMYRTIEKSWYVSMFYAVLNPSDKKLKFARAGHNPAIVLNKEKGNPLILQPAGIGLGLEMGDIFTKTLVEGELQLESGNTLIFYTDGFTEAMNHNGEEYGEERFLEFLKKNDNVSSTGLVNGAIEEINNFAGYTPQHDDMTMVVLKVL